MQRRMTENKRSIALIIALAILLITALGDVFLTRFRNIGLENELEGSRLLEQLMGASEEEIILQGTDYENRIVVLPIQGVIATDTMSGFQEDSVVTKLDEIMEDSSIQGMILEVDSPGGTVYESARIWEKIKELQAETDIEIYTSMGTVAASGGYYVAAPSDKIFAAEETITGSIGVIADYVNIAELEEKLGIKHEVIKSGKHKDIGSMNREMTEEERAINQAQVDEFFDKFVTVIAQGRGMSEEEVYAIADGQVYTGKQALANGLIDEIGYYEDALATMIIDLELEDPVVFKKTSEMSVWSQLLGPLSGKQASVEDAKTPQRSFESQAFNYIEENRGKGNLPEFYYLYGGI